MIKANGHKVNASIKSFLNYLIFLEKQLADDSFNFNEIRIIFEIWEQGELSAKTIETELDLDKGYTSRILKRLLSENLIQKVQSEEDKRLFYVSFTPKGKKVAQKLYKKYETMIMDDFNKLSSDDQRKYIDALEVIQKIEENKRK